MATTFDFKGSRMLGELREFGTFSPESQRYICRSLDIAFYPDAPHWEWARTPDEAESIQLLKQVYAMLPAIRAEIPKTDAYADPKGFLLKLIEATAFDMSNGRLESFAEYRFLYERLLGPAARPWLMSAFLAAVALPYFPAAAQRQLISSCGVGLTDDWSEMEPLYWPRWLGDGEALAA